MSDFKKVLCPTDFSDNADHALLYARALAENNGSSIDIVHVVDLGHNQFGPVESVYVSSADSHRSAELIREHAAEQMAHLEKKEHLLHVEVTGHIREGNTAEEVVAAADELGSDLIISATHGRTGLDHLLFGATADRIIRLSKVPVLSLKKSERDFVSADGKSLTLNSILCPMDFSDFSHSGLPLATALAKAHGAKIVLAHVVDSRLDYPEWTSQASVNNSEQLAIGAREELEKVAAGIEGVDVEVQVVVGISHRTLVGMANDQQFDLVVMPTHGRKGIAHALLGSVAEKVVRLADCPVLTIRPQ